MPAHVWYVFVPHMVTFEDIVHMTSRETPPESECNYNLVEPGIALYMYMITSLRTC